MLLRVEFLLKTDSGYPKDAEITLFTLANPGSSLRLNTWSIVRLFSPLVWCIVSLAQYANLLIHQHFVNSVTYGVATICRLLKITDLFCNAAL